MWLNMVGELFNHAHLSQIPLRLLQRRKEAALVAGGGTEAIRLKQRVQSPLHLRVRRPYLLG